jgi:hypothetical protein
MPAKGSVFAASWRLAAYDEREDTDPGGQR